MQIKLKNWNLAEATRRVATAALKESGSVEEAALLLGVTEKKLRRIMAVHEINDPADRPPKRAKRKRSK